MRPGPDIKDYEMTIPGLSLDQWNNKNIPPVLANLFLPSPACTVDQLVKRTWCTQKPLRCWEDGTSLMFSNDAPIGPREVPPWVPLVDHYSEGSRINIPSIRFMDNLPLGRRIRNIYLNSLNMQQPNQSADALLLGIRHLPAIRFGWPEVIRRLLERDCWISDEVLDRVSAMINTLVRGTPKFPEGAITQKFRSWGRKKRFHRNANILVPWHLPDHWIPVVFKISESKVLYADSKPQYTKSHNLWPAAERTILAAARGIDAGLNIPERHWVIDSETLICGVQDDSSSCGIATAMTLLRYAFPDRPSFVSGCAAEQRWELLLELVSNAEATPLGRSEHASVWEDESHPPPLVLFNPSPPEPQGAMLEQKATPSRFQPPPSHFQSDPADRTHASQGRVQVRTCSSATPFFCGDLAAVKQEPKRAVPPPSLFQGDLVGPPAIRGTGVSLPTALGSTPARGASKSARVPPSTPFFCGDLAAVKQEPKRAVPPPSLFQGDLVGPMAIRAASLSLPTAFEGEDTKMNKHYGL
ncbi:uncharacterized protein BXZ73DRAFT_76400 [Epithele typhae]|uniref:uncharacterized protein n=1 Tax=Epithele typhae TaxID=378194 RepID=UPI002008C82E|nr:uncharacterized protein BXZ73DRAFT_76400 [Epithele typhae]KAH9938907.1 hypothetical protein BXZ73DRAFT_76400 [Epithele typhae]